MDPYQNRLVRGTWHAEGYGAPRRWNWPSASRGCRAAELRERPLLPEPALFPVLRLLEDHGDSGRRTPRCNRQRHPLDPLISRSRLRRHSRTLIWSAGCQQRRGVSPRCLRGSGLGGESAPAVVDVCVATHMRGLVPHDRVCEMRSGAVLWRRAWPVGAAPSVLSGRSSRRCAGALSSPRPCRPCRRVRPRGRARARCTRAPCRPRPHGEPLLGWSDPLN